MTTLSGLAVAALLAGGTATAGSVPVNVTGDNGEDTLQQVLDNITDGGASSIDVNADQSQSDYWAVGGSGLSASQIVIEIAGYADGNAFGIYDRQNKNNNLELFGGPDSAGEIGSSVTFSILLDGSIVLNSTTDTGVDFAGNNFGFYLSTPDGETFYSDSDLNSDLAEHMVGYQGTDDDIIQIGNTQAGIWGSNEWIFGWEDLPESEWDFDYNDFVVIVESVNPVPEPMTLGLLGLGLVGMGVAGRRNRKVAAA